MDRKFILAFLLSSVVIFGYYSLYPPVPPKPSVKIEGPQLATAEAPTAETSSEAQVIATPAAAPEMVAAQTAAESSRKQITIEGPRYIAVIDTKEGVLTSMKLKEHTYALTTHMKLTKWVTAIFTGDSPSPKQWDPTRLIEVVGDAADGRYPLQFRLQKENNAPLYFSANVGDIDLGTDPQSLILTAKTAEGLTVIKTLTFDPQTFVIQYQVAVQNPTGNDKLIEPSFLFGTGPEKVDADRTLMAKQGGVYADSDFETYDTSDFEEAVTWKDAKWAVVMDTYFVQGVQLTKDETHSGHFETATIKFQEEDTLIPSLVIDGGSQALKNGTSYIKNFEYFVGPKTNDDLLTFDSSFTASLDLGWLDFLALPLLALLRLIQSYVVNWGVAIIILTLCVRTVMFPLAFKGMKSMRKMSRLNPRIKHLRSKYKNNKDKLNKEIMELYAKNKVNPVGGCLPLVMQVPIFIALYQALMPAIELRHQSFAFWMDNLSAPDHTLILPILMGVSMFVQQKLTPQPDMEPLQAKVMMWMPVLMVFFFLEMPMGLVLYWVASNLFTIGQQLIFNRMREHEIQQ